MYGFRLLLIILIGLFIHQAAPAKSWDVRPKKGHTVIQEVLNQVQAHDTLYIHSGTYLESNLVVNKPLTIIGMGKPVIDAEEKDEIWIILADEVLISGLVLKNVGVDFLKDRAGIRLVEVKQVTVENNHLIDTFFGIYVQNSTDCIIQNNIIEGSAIQEAHAGNAIHVWKSKKLAIRNNLVQRHRDGIYLEFVDQSLIQKNISRDNIRYGLHFMFSNYDTYEDNVFERNGSGVAVMFSKHIRMFGNQFLENWGGSSYGILLKEITDGVMEGNTFRQNTVGVYAEGANRVKIKGNDFLRNGKAMDIKGNCMDNEILSNNFIGNSFEVLTNSKSSLNHFDGNYWGQYKGYDLDKDGVGDVPHRPVNLFAMVTNRIPAAHMLLHSFLVNSLELAERLFPQMIPEHLIDKNPMIKPIQHD